MCPVCGHQFDHAGAPKRTMMGFPSLAAALQEAEDEAAPDPAKQTLFGFPAQKAAGGADEASSDAAYDDDESDEDESATRIIPASAIAFDSGPHPSAPQWRDSDEDEESAMPTMETDLRGTVAGMHLKPATDDGDDSTHIISGTAVFPGLRADDHEESDAAVDDLRAKGTLMGMSLADAQAQAPTPGGRSTQFAIPAVQAEKMRGVAGKPATSENTPPAIDANQFDARGTQRLSTLDDDPSEEQVDDLPTQAWSPDALSKAADVDGRKKLLEKIRRSRPDGGPETPTVQKRASDEGPDLSALKNLRPKRELHPTPAEFPDDIRDTNEQPSAPKPPDLPSSAPAAGVLRPAAARRTDSGTHRPPSGASGYSFGPGERPSQPESLESISDPEFGLMETDIATGDIVDQAARYFAGGDDESRSPMQPAAHQPQRTASKGVFETFDGGTASNPGAPHEPSSPMTVPTQLPTSPQAPQQQQEPTQRHPAQPQQLAQPQQPALHQQHTNPGGAPYTPSAMPTPAGEDDPYIRYIQAAFGVATGAIAILVQLFVWFNEVSPSLGQVIAMALAVVLGLIAVVAALYPIAVRIRTIAFFALAAALMACGFIGMMVGLPNTFLVIIFSALLAFVTGLFPYLSRLVA